MPQLTANGIKLEFEIFGKDKDPAILMIMGYTAQMTMWPEALCRGLADLGFRVIRFDNRDIGLSEKLERLGTPNPMAALQAALSGQVFQGAPYTLTDMAADAVGVLDGLRIDRAHIVGASMGGMIAQLVATLWGHRTTSLTSIMSTTGRPGLPQATPEAIVALTTPPPSTDRDGRIPHVMKLWRIIGSKSPFAAGDEELLRVAIREVDRSPYDPSGVTRQLCAIAASPPRHELLRAVTAPTLVLHGVDDPLVRVEAGRDTAASIAGAKLVEITGMGHDFTDALVPVYLREVGSFIQEAQNAHIMAAAPRAQAAKAMSSVEG